MVRFNACCGLEIFVEIILVLCNKFHAFKYFSLQGHPRLVSALCKLYSKLIERELNPLTEILVTAGAYEALFVTIMGTFLLVYCV